MAKSVKRFSVPLSMLEGNVDILLELGKNGQQLNCSGISMLPDPKSMGNAVLLYVHGIDREQQAEVGFQTRHVER